MIIEDLWSQVYEAKEREDWARAEYLYKKLIAERQNGYLLYLEEQIPPTRSKKIRDETEASKKVQQAETTTILLRELEIKVINARKKAEEDEAEAKRKQEEAER